MSSNAVRAVKGMNDVLPAGLDDFLTSPLWDDILRDATLVFQRWGYDRTHLPVVEETALFARGIGETTDVVSKEMYTFEDRGGRSLTLRPEGTAGAARALIQHNLARADPIQKWWYFGSMYRAERPQKGRYRQFYQIGAEFFGVATPAADVELLCLSEALCRGMGLTGLSFHINSLGDLESRLAYRETLRGFLAQHHDGLCANCQARCEQNPLRVLDCKVPTCREIVASAPDILESLTTESRQHFDAVLEHLDALGVKTTRDPHLVRGLDYYNGTIFELKTDALGAQDTVLGGGRYDGLVAQLGGPEVPAIGFALGVERLALLLGARQARGPALYVAPMAGQEVAAWKLAAALREAGVSVVVDTGAGRVKHQMKRADRAKARFALVLGESEVEAGRGQLKDLRAEGGAALEVELTPEAVKNTLVERGVA